MSFSAVRPACGLLLAWFCLAVSGCATGMTSGITDVQTQRAIEKAANDNSFPSAVEAGVASVAAP